MKRGFTLVELLIVMVIVGILVTIALPKYRSAMERGRATEGFTNLKAASDWINTKFVLNGNAYPDTEDLTYVEIKNASGSHTVIGATSRNVYFTTPEFVYCKSAYLCIQTQRKQGNEVYYTLTAYNTDGELEKITCSGEDDLCSSFGMVGDGTGAYVLTM